MPDEKNFSMDKGDKDCPSFCIRSTGYQKKTKFRMREKTILFRELKMYSERGKKAANSKKCVSLYLNKNWCDFIHYCEKIGYGEIQNLKIQDGLPQIAEVVKKKINFSKGEGSQK